jgi:hypothetical protein
MQKVAYLFHGHCRTWKECHKSFFENVFSQLPGDIFIHTWDTTDSTYGSYWSKTAYYEKFKDESLKIASETPDFQGIYKAYKPKVLLIEPNRDPDFNILKILNSQAINIKPSHLGVKNMLYQSKKLFDLANNYKEYDYFFSTRMDLLYTNTITEEEKSYMFQKNTLTCPYRSSDIWMFGDRNSIDIKTNFYSHIEEYWFKRKLNFYEDTYESALFEYLKENKIFHRASDLKSQFVRLPI